MENMCNYRENKQHISEGSEIMEDKGHRTEKS